MAEEKKTSKRRRKAKPEQVQEPEAQSTETSGPPATVTYIVDGKRVDSEGNVVGNA